MMTPLTFSSFVDGKIRLPEIDKNAKFTDGSVLFVTGVISYLLFETQRGKGAKNLSN